MTTTESNNSDSALGAIRQLIQSGQLLEAESQLQRLDDSRERTQYLYLKAVVQRLLKRPKEALRLLNSLVDEQPEHGRGQQEMGYCYLALQQPELAANAFFRATRANPALVSSWHMLALIHQQRGDTHASQIAENKRLALLTLPKQLLAATDLRYEGELEKAEQVCRNFLQQHKHHVDAMMLLADIGLLRKAYSEAEFLLDSCVALYPDHVVARLALVKMYSKLGKFAQALSHAQQLYQTHPDDPSIVSAYAHALLGVGRVDNAIEVLKTLLKGQPNRPALWLSLGHAYKAQGDAKAAAESYQRAAKLAPEFGDAYWSLANIKTYRFDSQQIQTLQQLASSSRLAVEDRIHVSFALGYAYEAQQAYDLAFDAYAQGNRLQHLVLKPDITRFETAMQAQQNACTATLFSTGTGGCLDPAPIFIVGMPRAGSTLLEQILASHPLVEGTMELHDVLSLVARINQRERPYPYVLADLTDKEFTALGEAYMDATRAYRTDKPYFIDKMPNNFVHIGLIKRMLPHAKIIDARRDPFACCFSVYKQLFAEGQEFSYSLQDLGRYYRAYCDLMQHWHRVLPGHILHVQYEDVLTDIEGQVRRLLDYCGLSFDNRCLRFYETDRIVKTPSAEQVRQPLYQTSKQHWQHFQSHLQPLFDILGNPT